MPSDDSVVRIDLRGEIQGDIFCLSLWNAQFRHELRRLCDLCDSGAGSYLLSDLKRLGVEAQFLEDAFASGTDLQAVELRHLKLIKGFQLIDFGTLRK